MFGKAAENFKTMELTHWEIKSSLLKFLKSKGFSDESLLLDASFTNSKGVTNVRPDIVGIDPGSKELLVIFEIKKELTEDKRAKYVSQVQLYAEIDKNRNIPVYLVTNGVPLIFHLFTKQNIFEQVNSEAIQSFEQYRAGVYAQKINNAQNDVQHSSDNFRILCIALAIILVFITVGDSLLENSRLKISLITANRLILIGIIVALLVFPYLQKFKGFGIEIERLRTESKK